MYCDVGLTQPYLILHDFQAGPRPTPYFIRNNIDYLDTLPFDGIAVYLQGADGFNATGLVFAPAPVSYEKILTILAPLQGVQLRHLRQNFAVMYAGYGIDVYDTPAWEIRKQNMRNFARALAIAGFRGIFFDNENYSDWAHYGGKGCSRAHTLRQCQDEMRERGREVMSSLVAEFPRIVVICLNGPWISDNTFYERTGLNNIANANELSGPFFVGLVEAQRLSATVVDGGEFYGSRTLPDFEMRYRDQKYNLVSSTGAKDDGASRAAGVSGFIPAYLRPEWASKISAGAGLYDRDAGMTPETMRIAIKNALTCVDRYAWLYTEGITFLQAPGTHPAAAPARWIAAVRNGRADWLQTRHARRLK